ncbi:hypothetical protein FACS1894216_18190 [Synergistales bacterium]|nr:hypothetical protein FACS1894216_18190 [Synergistales bacterium]
MTLGRALAYYVYIPLGGNRNGKLRTYVNLMAAFLVSGLWHGAAWSFVLWGVLHGAFSVCDRIFEEHLKKLPAKLRIACTFLIVNFLWVLFRAKDTGEAMKIYRGMLDLRNVNFAQLRDIGFDRLINFPSALFIANVAAFLSFCFIIVFCCDNSVENKNRFTMSYRGAIWAALLFFFALLHMSKPSPFIYYNF